MFEWLWAESVWFPASSGLGWKDLENKPGSDAYYPQLRDLNWSIVIGVVFIAIRYLANRVLFIPLGVHLGVRQKTKHNISHEPSLETAYRAAKTVADVDVERLSKMTDMTKRQIQVWFRKRQQNDATDPMHKFSDCCWHFLFYSAAFIAGLCVLWNKPWFADSRYSFIGWPHTLDRVVYWYYMLESAFYWSLALTLAFDHKRKDFKEMIVHHVATLFLIYFSWTIDYVRIGTLVLLVHDAADPFLSFGKMLDYAKLPDSYPTALFVCFLVVWIISRLYFYPFVVIHCTMFEAPSILGMDDFHPPLWLFNGLLCTLMLLHVMWTYSIARIVMHKLSAGHIKDVRSDSEDNDIDDSISEKHGENSY